MHLRQPAFTYKKNRESTRKFKETGDSRYIYQNELDKVCFQHDVAYGDFKDLTRRNTPDKIKRDKAFNFAKKPKYDEYQRGIASVVYTLIDKQDSGGAATLAKKYAVKNENISSKICHVNMSRREKNTHLL